MGRPTIIERARAYVAVMPNAVSGGGGHNATFAVACALVKGFGLTPDQAKGLMSEYNQRCDPPWNEKQLEHKLRQADTTPDSLQRGYLVGEHSGEIGDAGKVRRPLPQAPKPEYEPEVLREFAGAWAKEVDLVWLANRSAVDPATLGSDGFLQALYKPNEKVLLFNQCSRDGSQVTQGEALWPDQAPLGSGKYGVWFLPQPVDGLYHPNPRTKGNKMSRRSEESCLRFPYMVLESDDAPVREWLGALVQLPLKIAAIYTSGGRSVHALVRVDGQTKSQWDNIKTSLGPGLRFLITNGLDKGVLSAVRLSRLPQAWREGKVGSEESYDRFVKPALQKLLYINPDPKVRPICELWPQRNVVEYWLEQAKHGLSDADETDGSWLRAPLRYYAHVSKPIRECHLQVEQQWKELTAV